jgi:molybdate transport system ATP-binding protein
MSTKPGTDSAPLDALLHWQRGEFRLELPVSAPAGGIVALYGPSGSGKSTAINLLAGLLRPDAGHVRLGDEMLFDAAAGIDVPAHRRRIGYVFQDARLFPHLRVRDNLHYGLRRARGESGQSFDTVVALLGLEALLTRWPTQLSGGERQRVAIGRALLSQPRLLLLDEPLASLDAPRREEVLPYLERLRDGVGIPIVYVSHQFEEVLRLAAFVVLLDRGRCVARGDLPSVSLLPEARALLGSEAAGTIIAAHVEHIDSETQLAELRVGNGRLRVDGQALRIGQAVRLQLLARDLILSLAPPHGLSVRNELAGTVLGFEDDSPGAVLVRIDVGGPVLLVRVTSAAARELQLRAGLALWVLVKTVTLRGHVFGQAGH